MCISIYPKYAVAEAIRFLRGTLCAISGARELGKKQKVSREDLWAKGYAVSTVGFEFEKIKESIEHQEGLTLNRKMAGVNNSCRL